MPESSLPYKLFQTTHPEYRAAYWRKCQALYAGGQKLLCDPHVMQQVYPRHLHEDQDVYAERCARAFYINYPGSVIDLIVAGLFAEQPAMESDPTPDPWYEDWFDDVSRPGGRVVSFVDHLKQQMLTALTCQVAWGLVELPSKKTEEEPANALEEERSGALEVYLCALDPGSVRDWENDEDGKLSWALLAFQRSKRDGLAATRDMVEEEYVYYTQTEFARYVITYERGKPPKDDAPVPLVASGPHTFGRVPLVRLSLTDGMFAMGKLESLAVAHFNTRNALSWAQFKSLFPTPTAFVSKEQIGNPASEDPNRAVDQVRSPAHVMVLSDNDRYEYIGPPTDAFSYAASDCAVLRDEMYRVVNHMANSVDNSGAALKRSGESKALDLQSTNIVLKFLGEELAKYACDDVMDAVCRGRRDVAPDGTPKYAWKMLGMEEFNRVDMDALLKEATAVTTLDINSPTFQAAYKAKVAKEALGDDADAEMLKTIREELEENNSPEAMAPPMPIAEKEMPEGEMEMPEDDIEEEDNGKPRPTQKRPIPVAAHIRKPPGKA